MWGWDSSAGWSPAGSAPGRVAALAARLEAARKKFKEECGGDAADCGGLVIDEVSFLDPAALYWVDKLLRWLLNEPNVPFGGVLIVGVDALEETLAGSDEERAKAAKRAPSRKAYAAKHSSTSAWVPGGSSALSEVAKRR